MSDILDSVVDNDYQGLTLEKTCFDNMRLCGANFSNSNLKQSTFRNSFLIDADFRNADIRGCDFSNSTLQNANFENANMGIDADRFADLLFGSLGISALIGVAVMGSGPSVAAKPDDSVPIEYISNFILSTIFTLSGSVLFLTALFKALNDPIKNVIILDTSLAILFLFAFIFSLKLAIKSLSELSSTSFQNSDLTGAVFDSVIPNNVIFLGSKQDFCD